MADIVRLSVRDVHFAPASAPIRVRTHADLPQHLVLGLLIQSTVHRVRRGVVPGHVQRHSRTAGDYVRFGELAIVCL